MTLPELSLDDLTYEDLRQMAMRRIPAASGGRWSHHAPVDAGVTLLELFSFLLDQQLFVLDQVPDAMVHAILSLLGEAPKGTGIARTIVAADIGSLTDFTPLAAKTRIQPDNPALSDLIFSARHDALILPVTSLRITDDDRLISPELDRLQDVPVMTRYARTGTIGVEIELADVLRPEHAGTRVTIAVLLADPGVVPQWDTAAVDAPPPVALSLGWSGAGQRGTLDNWIDGTGGLRRSGLIEFFVPDALIGADTFRLALSTDHAAFAQPPHLSAIHVGAVIVDHRHQVDIAAQDSGDRVHDRIRAGLSDQVTRLLPISAQTIDLPTALSPVIEIAITLRLQDEQGHWHTWNPVADLTIVPPHTRAFAFDRALGVLSFGDGYAGRVPDRSSNLSASFELGGGPAGNHPAGLEWRLAGPASGPRLRSVVTATGGYEPESLGSARARIAGTLNERHRAVTQDDFVTLVETAAGIGVHRASVVPGHDPTFPCIYIADSVTVFVVPRTLISATTPQADDGALEVIRERLDGARMLTTRVFVARPRFRPVRLGFEIAAATPATPEFSAELRQIMSAYFHPSLGGPDGRGWPFGGALRPSELLRHTEQLLGPETRVERVSVALSDQPGSAEDCTELTIGPTELVYLDSLSVTLRPHLTQEVTL